jgi:hypothetical protein
MAERALRHDQIMLTKVEAEIFGRFGPDYDALWRDVQSAGDRVHCAAATDFAWTWHHLLLAAANFKARMPLFPAPLPSVMAVEDRERSDTLQIPVPGGPLTLRSEDPLTWRELSGHIKGLGVSRTTTVLSALWPGRHVIADWRALSAAAALIGARHGWNRAPVAAESTDRLETTWEAYSWYRREVLDCATHENLQPLRIERALYKLGDAMPGATWSVYASRIEDQLRASQ